MDRGGKSNRVDTEDRENFLHHRLPIPLRDDDGHIWLWTGFVFRDWRATLDTKHDSTHKLRNKDMLAMKQSPDGAMEKRLPETC
ncbi:Uu.00g065180.m01.CDS01 [Anthostomella pinea]|uniref:Uu.00g065180.m01.CDS01 n=1 Tax=Anthostomella pinea TaxID=933095 RepID=A0AAI8YN51_9PEZI|nr:Uu.00g065180.m01.CDS01 [Anthostomella pinea]